MRTSLYRIYLKLFVDFNQTDFIFQGFCGLTPFQTSASNNESHKHIISFVYVASYPYLTH